MSVAGNLIASANRSKPFSSRASASALRASASALRASASALRASASAVSRHANCHRLERSYLRSNKRTSNTGRIKTFNLLFSEKMTTL